MGLLSKKVENAFLVMGTVGMLITGPITYNLLKEPLQYIAPIYSAVYPNHFERHDPPERVLRKWACFFRNRFICFFNVVSEWIW